EKASQPSNRKLLLLRLACCRRIEHLLPNKQTKDVLTALERYVEGRATAEKVANAKRKAADSRSAWTRANGLAFSALVLMGDSIRDTLMTAAEATAWTTENAKAISELEERGQANLVRDIFTNPFRPVTVDPAWRSTSAVSLAKAIYEERAFDRMPILAD